MAARKAASGGKGVGGVLFDEDFAADAVQAEVEPMLSGLTRQRHRVLDIGERDLSAFSLGFELREQPSIELQK